MNEISKVENQVSAEVMQHVLGTGDLSKLTTQQRVDYYLNVCRSVGINPATRPFRFLTFQGQTQLYATRDCTDQLRQLNKISITIADKQLDGDIFIVTARASTPDGRRDEDIGAVQLGSLRGEARANATMKAMTKAKRRVTLSICGLGYMDESEVETLQGVATYDHEAEPPAVRLPSEKPPASEKMTQRKWLELLRTSLEGATSLAEVEAITSTDQVRKALGLVAGVPGFSNGAREELNAIMADAIARVGDGLKDEAEFLKEMT